MANVLDSHMADFGLSPGSGGLKNHSEWRPAVGIMAMSLNSHVVDRSLSPRPGGLNSRWACVHACLRF